MLCPNLTFDLHTDAGNLRDNTGESVESLVNNEPTVVTNIVTILRSRCLWTKYKYDKWLPGVKRSGREADHSPLSNDEVKE